MSEFNGDLLDEGLQRVMGKDRCQNPEDWQKALAYKKKAPALQAEKKVRDAQWEPVKENTYMDKLKACAKDALLFGGLSLIFFYFQQTGQMLPSAAMPCICTCVLIGGIGIGKHSVEG